MSGRARLNRTGLGAGASSSTDSIPLEGGWTLLRTEPAEHDDPVGLPSAGWTEALVPGTVASSLGPSDPDAHPDYDAYDWWYRSTLPKVSDDDSAHRVHLRFDGLATLADVWVNGTHVLGSTNMFVVHEVDVTDLLENDNEVVVVFRSLEAALSVRRPRPRWKTKLVSHQQLRWFRTTLLGRMPGWTPAIQPVGPWRTVWLERVTGPDLVSFDVESSLVGDEGSVAIEARLLTGESDEVLSAVLRVGDVEGPVCVEQEGGQWRVSGTVGIAEPTRWWPRTHGEATLYPCRLDVVTTAGQTTIECGEIGFRTVEVDRVDGRIGFVVNGVPVFCRGACWTTNDIVSLVGSDEALRSTLGRAAEANANMLRVGGTMVYESDAFYQECDRLGLMVWQDFMLANMDYPVDDEAFADALEAEATQQLGRLTRHPSVVAYCGGSEIEQQAAMFGAPQEIWRNDFLAVTLAGLVEKHDPGAAYWPSTPTGGALPFHLAEGLAHYYGVGAYRRPLDDVRLANVKFSPECLGFSNVPEPGNLRLLSSTARPAPHHPDWKKGVPRDTGAGWDFEDIRDHYLELLFGVDAVRLRGDDPDRYMRLSRTVTGRVMERVYDEWRSPESACGGGLVWFLKDLRPGAGWGILDSDGNAKPAYHYLRRAWAPVRLTLLDRGLDGVRIEIHNDGADSLSGQLEARVYNDQSRTLAQAHRPIEIPARGATSVVLEKILEHFADPAYAYRFGPPRHAAIGVVFVSEQLKAPLSALYWPDLSVTAGAVELRGTIDGDTAAGVAHASGLARDVRIEMKGATPSENYFDLPPDAERTFSVQRHERTDNPVRGFIEASNAPDGVRLSASE